MTRASWGSAFLGAFLLFAIQPLFAKWLLPTLGGNPVAWSLCLVCFQTLLVAGYAWAHWCAMHLTKRTQVFAQAGLLTVAGAVAVVQLWSPAVPTFASAEHNAAASVARLPLVLLWHVGLPYVALATTTPVLSHWAALTKPERQATGSQRKAPLLYAVSNAGSLLGLVCPLAIEPWVTVSSQLSLWAAAFAVFAAMMLATGWSTLAQRPSRDPLPQASPGPLRTTQQETSQETTARKETLFWFVGALVPSAMLVAATNHITVDIAATPLLWVLPLALYLISFILTFSVWRAPWRGVTLVLWALAVLGVTLNAFAQGAASLAQQVGTTLLALFTACLLCHGELARRRPAENQLTRFYLTIASGGALGSALVSVVTPFLFADYCELELAALAVFGVLLFAPNSRGVLAWPRWQRQVLWVATGLGLPLLLGSLAIRLEGENHQGQIVERRRGLLGPVRVVEANGQRLLVHGRIQHGMQLLDPTLRQLPTLYFAKGTALERVMQSLDRGRPARVGVLGLGVGTIAAYGRNGDTFRFYELDPNVIDLAQSHFTFLSDSAAQVEVVPGDGRLSISQEPPQSFDVIILDAFASDAVPVHLLTREAFSIYVSRLAPTGLLLANVSNRHLAVARVVQQSATANGLISTFIETPTNPLTHAAHVEWAVMADNQATLQAAVGAAAAHAPGPGVLWTDDHASVLSILR